MTLPALVTQYIACSASRGEDFRSHARLLRPFSRALGTAREAHEVPISIRHWRPMWLHPTEPRPWYRNVRRSSPVEMARVTSPDYLIFATALRCIA
jgi:hypothetical protein